MVGRAVTNPSPSLASVPQLPAFERLAAPASPEDLATQIEAWTKPGDAVLDLDGRGGWVARAAIAEQRRAVDFEAWPLTRLLAEVVLRPPDIRQIDAAAAGIAATRLSGSTIRRTIDSLFAGACPTCGRPVTLDAMIWEPVRLGAPGGGAAGGEGAAAEVIETKPKRRAKAGQKVPLPLFRFTPEESLRPLGIEYPCPHCHEQLGGAETRRGEATAGDVVLAQSVHAGPIREAMRFRFPAPRPTHPLVDEIIDLHTPRQLVGLQAILGCIDAEERIGAVTPALRLALLHAILLAGRLNVGHDRPASIRITNGVLRVPATHRWRERNPWLAFEDGLKIVKAFVQRVEVGTPRSTLARLGVELAALESGTANVVLVESTPTSLRRLALHGERSRHADTPSRVKLMLGHTPLAWNPDRLAVSYHATGWLFGAAAVSMLPYGDLFHPAPKTNPMEAATEMAAALGRSLAVAAPALASNGRAVILLDDAEPASLIAAALGGAAAGCRLVDARLRRGGEDSNGIVVYVPPTGVVAPGPRTRANRPLPPVSGGAGDPGTVSGRGMFAPPERLDEGPFRPSVALQNVTDTAVELLKARGEPASFEQLLGELLMGLDRCGQLARLARQLRPVGAELGWDAWIGPDKPAAPADAAGGVRDGASPRDRTGDQTSTAGHPTAGHTITTGAKASSLGSAGHLAATEPPLTLVEQLLNLIREELDRPNNRRICQIEPGRYWLASNEDRSNAQQPLADRVEWSVFSLLSSSNPMSRRAAFERTIAMFKGGEVPDGALIDACLESYAARTSTPESILGFDQLETRTIEHDAVIARLADLGHRLGMRVWIGKRQQARRISGQPLSAWLDPDEQDVHLPLIAWAPDGELERLDCAWYVRRKATFLFEVEWTAMLGEPILVHHSRYPADDRVVRFLVVPPERARLVAFKLARSPLLRKAVADRNWHFLKWNHLAEYSVADEVTLAALEPYLGLEAPADKAGEQLPLFGG